MSSENPSFESYQAEFRRLNFLERYQIEEFPDTDTVLLSPNSPKDVLGDSP